MILRMIFGIFMPQRMDTLEWKRKLFIRSSTLLPLTITGYHSLLFFSQTISHRRILSSEMVLPSVEVTSSFNNHNASLGFSPKSLVRWNASFDSRGLEEENERYWNRKNLAFFQMQILASRKDHGDMLKVTREHSLRRKNLESLLSPFSIRLQSLTNS